MTTYTPPEQLVSLNIQVISEEEVQIGINLFHPDDPAKNQQACIWHDPSVSSCSDQTFYDCIFAHLKVVLAPHLYPGSLVQLMRAFVTEAEAYGLLDRSKLRQPKLICVKS